MMASALQEVRYTRYMAAFEAPIRLGHMVKEKRYNYGAYNRSLESPFV